VLNRRKHSTGLVLALILSSAVQTARAQDAAKGADLLASARAALGGEDKLRAVKTLDVQGEFKRAVGQVTLDGDLQIRLQLPDKLRRDEDTSLPGGGPTLARTEVLNGTSVWDETNGGGGAVFLRPLGGGAAPRGGRGPIDPAQIEELQRRTRQADLARFVLAWLLTTDASPNWVGTAESPDGKADVLEFTGAALPATKLFLDQTSHLPLMISWQGIAPQVFVGRRGGRAGAAQGGRGDDVQAVPPPQQATLRMTLGDYKTVSGIKLPHRITRGVDDMTNEEWTIKSYKINPSFKNDVFTKK
jgi:hypothetical protein